MVDKNPSLKVRFIVYPLIAGFFLLGCYLITLLAMGYNLKFVNGKLEKERTGIIILTTRPGNAEIFLDDKPYNKSTPLFNFMSINVDRLSVGAHKIKLQKEGYETWEGQFEVKSGLVSWGNYILLLPREREYSEYGLSGIKQVITSDDERRMAVLTEDTESGLISIYVINPQNKESVKIYDQKLVAGTSHSLKSFSYDEDRLYFEKETNKVKTGFAVVTRESGTVYPLFEGLKSGYTVEAFNPANHAEFYLKYEQTLYTYNYEKRVLSGEVAKNVLGFRMVNGEPHLLQNTNDTLGLWKLGQRPENILKTLPGSGVIKVQFIPQNQKKLHLVLTSEGYLFSTSDRGQNYNKLAEGVQSFKVSREGKYIYFNDKDSLRAYEIDHKDQFVAVSGRKIESYTISEDESNVFFVENGALKMVNYNGFYEHKIADVKSNALVISSNYNLFFLSERADKKIDLKVFSFNL